MVEVMKLKTSAGETVFQIMGKPMVVKSRPTAVVEIFMVGCVDDARRVCRRYCMDMGLCVAVTPTSYIYTGGEEAGFVIGLRNYPRFPSFGEELHRIAHKLAEELLDDLSQYSAMIVDSVNTTWISRCPDGP